MPVRNNPVRCAVAIAAAVGLWLGTSGQVEASLARNLGRPISAYSASLFGKKNLTATQTQTLTCDPDEPLAGSTSTLYDPSIVTVSGFGRGPGYIVNPNSPFPSGFGIELFNAASPNGKALVDLGQYLDSPVRAGQTGYLRMYFQVSGEGVGQTGKLIDDPIWRENHLDYEFLGTDGPVGVDTHYYDFTYLLPDDPRNAVYTVFAELADKHYIESPQNPGSFSTLESDFVLSQSAPEGPWRPGPDFDFVGATVPEPAGITLLVGAAGAATLARKRRRA
jgi:hypothetical protein